MIGEHELTMPGGLAHIGEPPDNTESVLDRLPRKGKRHVLESELSTAEDLAREYVDSVSEHTCEECGSGADVVEDDTPLNRQKLIWLLERLQEEIL